MDTSQQSLSVGYILQNGKYKIVRFINSGGFGCTYEAIHTVFETRVAIKEFFVKDFCNRDEASHVSVGTNSKVSQFNKLKKKFIDEAKALHGMHHQGIVHVSDIFEENGTAYYVMDYIDGKSLQEIVKQGGPLSESDAVKYILQVADALKYVHSKNRLHLDIKPGNIMIDSEGNAILIDFGASKHYDEETGENTSTLLGINTKGYAPIEQMHQSFNTFNAATDIYSLGATLYKLLTGTTPPDAVLIASGEIDKPELSSKFSDNVRNVINQSMMLKRTDRPQSVTEFMTLLNSKTNKDFNSNTEDVTVLNRTDTDISDSIKQEANLRHHSNSISRLKELIITKKTLILVFVFMILSIVVLIGICKHDSSNNAEEYRPVYTSAEAAISAHDVQALKYYADHGNSKAAAELGDIYRWGLYGVTDTLSRAIEWYEKSFELGNTESAYKLGTMYKIINADIASDKSIEWLRKAAESGEERAYYLLGDALRYEDDRSESLKWIRKACERGDLKATNRLAEGWYKSIDSNLQKNAQQELLDKAKGNDPEAIGYVASLYMNGYLGHSPRDLSGCYPWAKKGYQLNDANSTETLGWYYYCLDDESKANQYFDKAAELGSILAMAKGNNKEFKKKRVELLFNGDVVLEDGFGIYDASQYYTNNEDREKWHRRAIEYGWTR